ncbi:MAG: tetratricopeptide repeat-containing sensor histidine kinase [Bacteroidota bacterium]|nr:tetratricopeptide repeat-containing sensor histidine kinase [Bacteroidota bacterium]
MTIKQNIVQLLCLGALFTILSPFYTYGQESKTQKLNARLRLHPKEDTVRTNILGELANSYIFTKPDSAKIIAEQNIRLTEKINDQKNKAKTLVILSIINYRYEDGKQAIKLSEKALEINKKINNQEGVAYALNNMANIYHEEGELDLALRKYEEALKIAKDLDDKISISDFYNNIGNLYRNKGNYILALQYLFDALSLRETLNDSLRMEITLGNLSGVFFDLKKLDESEKYSRRASIIQKSIGDLEGLIQTEITLGSVYAEKERYLKALEHYEKAIEYAKELKNINAEAVGLANLGDIYLKIKMPSRALKVFEESLKICQKMGDIRGLSVSETGIGNALLMQNKVKESIVYLEKGYANSVKIESVIGQIDASEQLANAYEKTGQLAKSIAYHKLYKQAKAKLLNTETSNKAQQIEFNYLLEKKENEIALLEKEKSLQEAKDNFKELLILTLIALILFLVIMAYLIHVYRVKETHAKELILNQQAEIINQTRNLEELNLFKDKTFSILSHDLRTPIANLNGILNLLDVNLLSTEDFNLMIVKLKDQFKSINVLLENTLNWAKSQMSGELLPAKEQVKISEIVQRNFDLFKENLDQKEITATYMEAESIYAFADPNHLDIILRNILLNAIKFTHKNGQIKVKSSLEDQQIKIAISDTGSGMSEEKIQSLFKYNKQQVTYGTDGEKGAGIGLILTQEIAMRNAAQIKVESTVNMGTTFTIIFPIHTNS